MPQMAPSLWLPLFFMFTFSLYTFISLVYPLESSASKGSNVVIGVKGAGWGW